LPSSDCLLPSFLASDSLLREIKALVAQHSDKLSVSDLPILLKLSFVSLLCFH